MSLHDPLAHLGPLQLHPFGASAAAGLALGFVLALWCVVRTGLPAARFPGTFVVVVLGGFMTARLTYVAFHPELYGGAQGIFSIWDGGFNLAGGVAGGAALLAVLAWARRESFWRWSDAVAPATSLGLAVGMLGLPGSGEGWGMPTGGPIYMAVSPDRRPASLINATRFHPIFAYEAICFAVIAAVLFVLLWRSHVSSRPNHGTVGLVFLVLGAIVYGGIRPLTLDASTTALVLRTQGLCLAMAAAGATILAVRAWRRRHREETERELAATYAANLERQERFIGTPRGARSTADDGGYLSGG
jgi:phosphatidylglycerol:prolipoprotein diacylglycerol transferase